MAKEVQERFTGREFWYNFESGPKEVRSLEDAYAFGNNCVALAHLIFNHLHGVELPPELHCYEMFANNDLFPTVSLANMQPGALVWFAPRRQARAAVSFVPEYENDFLKNYRQGPAWHIATYIGDQDGDQQFMHATHLEGTNVTWPLERFPEVESYESISRVAQPDVGKIALLASTAVDLAPQASVQLLSA